MLPKVEVPTYELTLPSIDQKIKYRPFLVKEEKLLLLAMESKNESEMVSTIKNIVTACTFNSVNADVLPMFDIEYIFLNIRAKSIGEVAKFKVICPDDNKTYVDAEIDLSKVEVHVDDDHTNKIILDEKRQLGIVLKYPTLDSVKVGSNIDEQNVETVFTVLSDCIDHIFEGDKIYPAKDNSKEELKDFIESLPQQAFKNIKKFFDSMPKLKHEIEVVNPNTNIKSKVTFTGLQDFFV